MVSKFWVEVQLGIVKPHSNTTIFEPEQQSGWAIFFNGNAIYIKKEHTYMKKL
jgi:hypothetical protein